MARLVESRSKKPVRDVRAFEEDRCLTLPQAIQLEEYISSAIQPPHDWPSVDRLFLRDAYAIRILLRTGLRRFEFCKLRCGDFVPEEGKLWTVGKGNIKDFVPLPDAAVATIREWLALKAAHGESVAPRAFLFVGRGDGPLSFSSLRNSWKAVLKGAGLLDKYGLHTLRHTAGLIVWAKTENLEKTARFLRHVDTATTSRFYLHIDAVKLRAELSEVELWK